MAERPEADGGIIAPVDVVGQQVDQIARSGP